MKICDLEYLGMNVERDVLTTQQAAKLLGLSTTSVQKMVINGELDAWVTPGGHRRIFRSGVEQLLNSRNEGLAGIASARPLQILLVEDDPVQIAYFKAMLARIGHASQLTIVSQAGNAMTQIRAMRPDLLVIDWVMEPQAGPALVQAVGAEPALKGVDILALGDSIPQEELAELRLPRRLVRYNKPMSADRLCGYLDALTVRIFASQGSKGI